MACIFCSESLNIQKHENISANSQLRVLHKYASAHIHGKQLLLGARGPHLVEILKKELNHMQAQL